jgi:condensin complex subunit 2
MENRTPLKARVHSPAPCLLTPNDDDRERAQVRLARAAALRRKSGLAPDVEERLSTMRQQESNVLSKERILELHNNCIKLAAENKITQRNTWDLKLIDHLSTLVEGDDEDEDQTNFQKASCTLEAGVRIYSTRVDSVHTEAYKVLGGLSRTTAAPNRDNTQCEDTENSDNGEANVEEPQKYSHKKVGNCSSTLEASFANFNIKKFDGENILTLLTDT